ncbi:MAG: hypothetical protein CEE38_13745 [Planctomycetes bacterium B3_Pla]|nr:MAG: hypothetical protein CEE38_13745 [Planctomycetes bacterium B3_Pla]
MNSEYHIQLNRLKESFDSANEISVAADAIQKCIPCGELNILDVGIGEGKAAIQLIGRLSRMGYAPRLTGIDIYVPPSLYEKSTHNIKLCEIDFASYPLTEKFDVVVATQSLYYLGSPELALRKLASHTRREGILLVTMWSNRCELYQLHERFCADPDRRKVAVQHAARMLREIDNYATVEVVTTVGKVDFTYWQESEETCLSAFRVLARAESADDPDLSEYAKFRELITVLPLCGKRENGTIISWWDRKRGGNCISPMR